jgi:hypothetical protein
VRTTTTSDSSNNAAPVLTYSNRPCSSFHRVRSVKIFRGSVEKNLHPPRFLFLFFPHTTTLVFGHAITGIYKCLERLLATSATNRLYFFFLFSFPSQVELPRFT